MNQQNTDGVYGDQNILPNTVMGAKLVDGSLGPTKFASTIVPPEIVTALPALPNASYPMGKIVFLTTDAKLYRNTDGSTWSKAVDGLDIIADSITAGQIAAAAIGVSELAAEAVTAAKISAGSILARHLNVGAERLNLVVNGSFEEFVPPAESYVNPTQMYGWSTANSAVLSVATASANAKSGKYILAIKSADGTTANSGLFQFIPVKQGRTYRLSGWAWKAVSGGQVAQILAHSYDKDANTVAFNVMVAVSQTTATPLFGEAYYKVPAGVAYLSVNARWGNTPGTTEVFAFEDVVLEEVPGGLRNTSAEVVIDDTGVSILNGALTFADRFGASAMDGYGFGPSWVRFIRNGFYNGDFANGSTSDMPVSETGSGTPLANYLASLSVNLPAWVVASSGGTLKLVADSNATGGLAIQSTASAAAQVNRWYQDIPILPNKSYRIEQSARWTITSGTITHKIFMSWRDSTHAIIGARTQVSNLSFAATQATYGRLEADTGTIAAPVAPSDASYLRVEVEITHVTTASQTYWLSDIRAIEVSLTDGNQTVSSLTLTTTNQDAFSTTLVPGRYLLTGFLNTNITTAGVGDVTATVDLDGVTVGGAVPIFAAPTATAKTAVPVVAYVNVQQGAAGVLSVKCKKSIAAGVATVTGGTSNLVLVGLN